MCNDEYYNFEEFDENIEEKKKQFNDEIKKEGFLPINEDYNEEMRVSQEKVEKNPTRYIIPECIPACMELWSKNIYTFMVSDYIDSSECWIEIAESALSTENKEIYSQLTGDDVIKFSYHYGTLNFGVKGVGLEAQKKLLELAKQFQMQDVEKNNGYIDLKTFLLDYCECYDIIDNPNYRSMADPWKIQLSIEELRDYILKYDEWERSIESKEKIKKFNPNKINDSIENLVKKHNMILDGDRIYLSPFHYKKHLNYLKYLDTMQSQSHI